MHSFMADIIPVEFQGLATIECVQKLLNVPFFSSSTIYSPAQYHNLPLQSVTSTFVLFNCALFT